MRYIDLTRYTILQSVKPIPAVHFESNAVTDFSWASPTVFIAYKFSYHWQERGLQTPIRWKPPHVFTQRDIQRQEPDLQASIRWQPPHLCTQHHIRHQEPSLQASIRWQPPYTLTQHHIQHQHHPTR